MSEGNELKLPTADDERVKQQREMAIQLMSQADLVTIDSNDMYEIANDLLSNAHAKLKELEAKEKSITDPISAGLKAVRDLFRKPKENLEVTKTTLKRKMLAYQTKIEEERKAAEAEVERQRQADIEAARQEAVAAEAEVDKAVDAGDTAALTEAANRLVEAEDAALAAEVATPHVVATAKPSSGGHALGKTYKAEIIDLPKFLRHMADLIEKGDAKFDKTVDIKMGQLNQFAKATKGTVPIPGIKFVEEKTLAAR
jgi:hypothetical protein